MQELVFIVHILAAIFLIALVLMQHGKGADMGAAFGGGSSQTVFGSIGSVPFLTKVTAIIAALFCATSIGLGHFIAKQAKQESVVAAAAAPVVPAVPVTPPATSAAPIVPVAPALPTASVPVAPAISTAPASSVAVPVNKGANKDVSKGKGKGANKGENKKENKTTAGVNKSAINKNAAHKTVVHKSEDTTNKNKELAK